MSVTYTYDEKHNILFTRFFGIVSEQDLRYLGWAVAADPRIKPGVRELVDLTDIEGVRGSSRSLEDNIQIDCAHGEKLAGMRTAIVADTDFLFGYARMYKSLCEVKGSPLTVEVFKTKEKAKEWLGL